MSVAGAREISVMAMLVSPAANCWSGLQELNTRQKYGFTFRRSDAACPKSLSRVAQTFRTNINSEAMKLKRRLLPAPKQELGKATEMYETIVNRKRCPI